MQQILNTNEQLTSDSSRNQTVANLLKKLSVFYETLRFITTIARVRQWTLSTATSGLYQQPPPPPKTSLRSISLTSYSAQIVQSPRRLCAEEDDDDDDDGDSYSAALLPKSTTSCPRKHTFLRQISLLPLS